MKNILTSLLSKSPFKSFQEHLEEIKNCVLLLNPLIKALKNDMPQAKSIALKISEHEHNADKIKDSIRDNLSKSLLLPIGRSELLEILSIQDAIGDVAEDISVLCTIKENFKIPEEIFTLVEIILDKSVETFNQYFQIIYQMDELLESTFTGAQAEKIRKDIEQVAYLEHETDNAQKVFLKNFFLIEESLSKGDFYILSKLSQILGDVANISEKAANKIRLILLK